MTVEPFAGCGQNHKAFVAAEFIPAKRLAGVAKGLHRCQQRVDHLARFVGPLDDARALLLVEFLRGVVLAVGHGANAPHVFRAEGSAGPDGFVAEIGLLALAQVGAHQKCGRHRHRSGSFDKFHSHVKEGVRTSGYF